MVYRGWNRRFRSWPAARLWALVSLLGCLVHADFMADTGAHDVRADLRAGGADVQPDRLVTVAVEQVVPDRDVLHSLDHQALGRAEIADVVAPGPVGRGA